VTKIAAQGSSFEQSLQKRICRRLGFMLCKVPSKIRNGGARALSHLRLRWMGGQSAFAFQPIAAIQTELLQRKIVREECRGAAGTPVTIFHCACLDFARWTGEMVHSWCLLYSPRTFTDSLVSSHFLRHNAPLRWQTTVQSLHRTCRSGSAASPIDVETCVHIV